jgi:hypothetical protein
VLDLWPSWRSRGSWHRADAIVSDVAEDVLREKLLVAFDLFEAGVDMMRQQLRRAYPAESEAEIERRVTEWLHHRPGALHGDSAGRVGTWPRSSP